MCNCEFRPIEEKIIEAMRHNGSWTTTKAVLDHLAVILSDTEFVRCRLRIAHDALLDAVCADMPDAPASREEVDRGTCESVPERS